MADWVSSLLAGLGAGAESLGTSMTEREKRNAAAKQRAFELAMQQADKNAELGITDIAPRLPSEPALTKMSDTIGRIGALGKPQSMDMLSDQLGLRPAVGGQVQKFTTPSPDFSIGGPTPDMSDAATNYEVSRTGALTFGPRPTSPRFDNFTDQTVVPAATPATGGGANASIAKMLQPDMAPPAPKTTAPVSAAEQDLIDYGKQVQANPKARQTLASVMKGKTPEEQAVFMADRLTAGKLPAARQVEFDKLKAMGPKAYLNDVDIRMTPDMGPPLSMAGSDTPPAAPPSTPFAAPMAAEAGPRTVSALGAPTMPRTRLGSIPDVQSQFGNVPGFTGVTPENASYVMQYDPLHPEAGPIRKRIDYKQGTDYLAMQARQDAEEKKVIAERKALAEQKHIDDRDARKGDHVTLQTLTTNKMPKAMSAIAAKNFADLTSEEIQALPALSTLAKTLAAQASAKELAAIAAAPGRDAASEQRRFNRESTLSKEYEANRVVKDARLVGEAVQAVQASAQQNTPASDIAMLYNVVKLLDPASAVREGEINLQLAARSLGTRVTAAWLNAKNGNKMTQEERNNIVAMLGPRVNGIRAQVAPIQQTFGRRAAMYGADSSAVAPDPLAGVSVGRPSGFRPSPTRK